MAKSFQDIDWVATFASLFGILILLLGIWWAVIGSVKLGFKVKSAIDKNIVEKWDVKKTIFYSVIFYSLFHGGCFKFYKENYVTACHKILGFCIKVNRY